MRRRRALAVGLLALPIARVRAAKCGRPLLAILSPAAPGGAPYSALLTMGPSIPVPAERAAGYVDRILKGARPVELPSVLTTLVNRRAAKALALNLPNSLIARADEVIE